MIETDYARKIDSMGRITVPAKLREELGLQIGKVYKYFTCEENSKTYLCIECPTSAETEIEHAKSVLEKAGYTF